MANEEVEPIEDDDIITHSPTPLKEEVIVDEREKLDFYSAVEEILVGKHVTKLEWGDDNYYGFMAGDLMKLHKTEGTVHDWIISRGDIEGTDYVVLN